MQTKILLKKKKNVTTGSKKKLQLFNIQRRNDKNNILIKFETET